MPGVEVAEVTGGPEVVRAPSSIGIADNHGMTVPFPSPTTPASGRVEVFVRYLDYFRETLLSKVLALSDDEVRRSRLPSGWTPLELLKHLRYVELRWIEWGFEGSEVDDPWGDRRGDRWYVAPDETRDSLAASLRAQGAHTASVVASNDLAAVGAPGPRWDGAAPAALERVLFHLVQEYARHLGHLDVVAELASGPVGE
ncbi:DUF664 domain-containing protein [Micromonospora maritima]|uniref:DUF664 domain-containing protein n=1 Tax=Micromonospora maritima TaxID=986711 RepID=A0ABW7ZJN8_9ACTN